MATSSLAIGPSIDSCNLIKIGKKNNVMSRDGKGGEKGLEKANFVKGDDGTNQFFVTFFRRNIYIYIWIS